MRRSIALLAALAAFLGPPRGAAAHDMPAHAVGGVPRIIAPADGAVVQGPVTLRFRFAATPVQPGAPDESADGHVHLLIDAAPPPPGEPVPVDEAHLHFMGGDTETVLELPPGRHTLQLIVAGADHVPANPPVISNRVSITVRPGTAASGAAAAGRRH